MIKLNHQDQVQNNQEQKPIDQFQKIWLESLEISILHCFENLPKNQNLCLKHEIKCKRKGKKDLPALREENLAKRTDENDKKLRLSLDRVVWREKS